MIGPEELYVSYVVLCVFNAFLSYTAITFNIIIIHAIRKTTTLTKTLKTLLLSLAVSDLGVGLLVQPLYSALHIMELKQNTNNNPTYKATYIAFLISGSLFFYASFFGVMTLSTDRFLAVHLFLRYKELVTHKRVVIVVISFWVFSSFVSLIKLWIPAVNIIHVIAAIIGAACVITATFFSVKIYLAARGHINQVQTLQEQQEAHGEMVNVVRVRKFAITAIYVYLVFMVCYLPHICIRFGTLAPGSSTDITVILGYTRTLMFLNSTLNPLIYSWKMRHIRHTIMDILRKMQSELRQVLSVNS